MHRRKMKRDDFSTKMHRQNVSRINQPALASNAMKASQAQCNDKKKSLSTFKTFMITSIHGKSDHINILPHVLFAEAL